ncbi:dTDP-4-dehydrorhamnose 3,5-epimerase [Rubinisphaera italica]|uniref:dTDP-4-dehydrorhamnose 3,5-epimerase n=1 Tax=Rubinisphaera italica TaxID=2527969 RepID=A0A5C5XKI1_9PLAN|nr:dTDP-4-dehydrorhamnose 3,5-epimerase [Rubinisphaera italica]TWT62645.1 dTDP-4-dehydrorhamnose 3,5-epimerase [Rubinisphaera italica]
MKILPTSIADCSIVELDVFGDSRGFFMEMYRQSRYTEFGIDANFVQDNYSRSRLGTLRGLHYQLKNPQGKLVQVLQGEVYDVAVDLREDSPTFRQWTGVRLNAQTPQQLYVPPGCAHGFYVLSDSVDFLYKCTADYDAADEHVLMWNDPQIGIEWPMTGDPILSEKDKKGLPFTECATYPAV